MSLYKSQMNREINLPHASSIMIGVVIGSGIFVSPVSFTRHCGSVAASLIMWVISGFLALSVALCFNELGSVFPTAGGQYAFFKEVMGPFVAFLDAWIDLMIAEPSFYAILGLITTDYLFYAIDPHCPVPPIAAVLLTVWIIVTVGVVNSLYVRYVKRIQAFFTIAKLGALCIIIVAGIVQIAKGKTKILETGFEGTSHDPGGYAVAIQSGLFTYSGWQYIFCLMEEVKNPVKIVPRATVASFAVVIVLYALTNVAYFTVMTPQEMLQSKAVAVDFANRTLGPFAVIMPICVAASTIGALNGVMLGGSRIFFAAARDNLFPGIMSTIQGKYLTPWPSVIIVVALSSFYVVVRDAVALVEYLGFCASFMQYLTVVCLLYLRWKKPDLHRPFKLPLFVPIVAFIVMTLVVILGLYHNPIGNGIGLLIMLSGLPIYILGVHGFKRINALQRWSFNITTVIQKTFVVLPTDRPT